MRFAGPKSGHGGPKSAEKCRFCYQIVEINIFKSLFINDFKIATRAMHTKNSPMARVNFFDKPKVNDQPYLKTKSN